MPEDVAQENTGQIPTNLRLLMVLEEVARAGVPVAPATVGDALGLPKPTIHRLFNTAEDEGFLQRDIDGRSYGPGPRMRRLSANTLSSQRVRSERLRILRALAEKIGETCNIATPGREGMVYLERVETHWPLRIQLPIGTQVPFHCTASGKMYLSSLKIVHLDRYLAAEKLIPNTPNSIVDGDKLKAALAEVHKLGYSTDDEEFMEGMAAIAVPISDDQGRLLSTLSVHAPLQRHDLNGLKKNFGILTETAKKLAALAID